jgi:hypothetical protein
LNAGEDGHTERRLDAGGSGHGTAAISEPEGGGALAEPAAATSLLSHLVPFFSFSSFCLNAEKFLTWFIEHYSSPFFLTHSHFPMVTLLCMSFAFAFAFACVTLQRKNILTVPRKFP